MSPPPHKRYDLRIKQADLNSLAKSHPLDERLLESLSLPPYQPKS